MELFASWTRATVANIERALARWDGYYDRILLATVGVLGLAILFLFTR